MATLSILATNGSEKLQYSSLATTVPVTLESVTTPVTKIASLPDKLTYPSLETSIHVASEAKKRSPLECCLLLGATGLGTGMLFLPEAMAAVGYVTFFLVLGASSIVSATTTFILCQAVSSCPGESSYSSLLVRSTHPCMALVLHVVIIPCIFGSMVVYFLFLSRYVRVFPFWPESIGPNATIVIFGLIDFPLTLPIKVTALTKLSGLTFFSLSIMMLCILAEVPSKIESRESSLYGFAEDSAKLPAVVCICIFTLMWHTGVVGIARELERPTPGRCATVAIGATMLTSFLYALIAFGGFVSFGADLKGDIVSQYVSDPLFLVVRFLISCSLLISIPVNTFPLRESILEVLRLFPPCAQLELTLLVRLALSVAIIGGMVFTGIVYPDTTSIVQLMGGSLASLLMILFPALIARLVMGYREWLVFLVASGVLCAGLFIASLGLIGEPLPSQ